MTNKTQRYLWLLIAVIFAVCLTVFTLSRIVTEPWHILPDIGGDGAKNNFTYLYHSVFGKGYWFDGMNYPYGEHIVYTDGQPLLSVFFAKTGNVSVATALTVCWTLLGIAFVLAIVYIYKTLVHFRIPHLPALLFAGLIGVMTPQILCLTGHYALGYPCIIPMLFYWNIRYFDTGKPAYCIYIFLLGITVSFLHMYYAGMMLVWMAAYTAGYFIFIKNTASVKLKHVAPLLGSVAGISLIVAMTLKLTDPVKDRPITPLSLPESYAHIKQIITSAQSPIWKWTEQMKLIWQASKGGEGFCYPGAVIIAVVSLFFAYLVTRRLAKKKPVVAVSSDAFSPIWPFMALSVLAFSMGIPFIWHMHWLMNYFSFFKQFRALGRFSWIFYYIITVYGVVIIYTLFYHLQASGKKALGYALLIGSFGLWGYEASGYIKMSRKMSLQAIYNYDLMYSTHEQSWTSFLNEHHLTKDDFQGILALKFFHIGSEKLWVGDGSWTITLASRAALQLHLPIVDVMMSRTSWGETKKQVRIGGGPYSDKPLLRDIKSTKPFLLMYFEEDSLDLDQKYLLTTSDFIGHYSQCYVYVCNPEKLAASDKKYRDEINATLPYMHTGDTCIGTTGSWYVNHCDNQKTADHLFGVGASPAIKGNDSVIATIPVKTAGDSQLYEFSAWFLLGSKDFASPELYIDMLDDAGRLIGKTDINTKQSVDNYDMWFRANGYFYIKKNCAAIRCRLVNTPNPSYIAMDEMMLRPANATVISRSAEGRVMVNNHLFNTAKQ